MTLPEIPDEAMIDSDLFRTAQAAFRSGDIRALVDELDRRAWTRASERRAALRRMADEATPKEKS